MSGGRGRSPRVCYLTRAAAGFARATGDYERFAPDIGRAYRLLRLPDHVDVEAVARHELRWWVVRREIGLAAGDAAGDAITDLYAALYDVPRERVAEAGRLRGDRRRGPRPRRDRRSGRARGTGPGVLARGGAPAARFVSEPAGGDRATLIGREREPRA